MRNISILVALAAVLASGQEVSAQLWTPGQAGEEIVTFSLQAGAVSPRTTFSDGSSFEGGATLGASVVYWPASFGGLKTYLLRGEAEGRHGDQVPFSPIGAQQPTVWLYGLEAVLRLPMGGPAFGWFPYVSGGLAGKTYRWSVDRPYIGTSRAGFSVAGGLELRPGGLSPFGVVLEGRLLQHPYDFMGYDDDYRDLVITAGISASI